MKRLTKAQRATLRLHVRLPSKAHIVMTPKKGKGSYKRTKFRQED